MCFGSLPPTISTFFDDATAITASVSLSSGVSEWIGDVGAQWSLSAGIATYPEQVLVQRLAHGRVPVCERDVLHLHWDWQGCDRMREGKQNTQVGGESINFADH